MLTIVSPPEASPLGDGTGSIACARLKNSSFLRWKRTSTLVTPKVTSFRVNLHGLGSSRIRYQSFLEPGTAQKRRLTHRVHSIFHAKLALWVDSMIADDVPHTGDDQDLTVRRAAEEVGQIREELLSERIDGKFINLAILYCGMCAVDEWPDLPAGS